MAPSWTALLRKYLKIWTKMASMSLQSQISYRLGSLGFLLGKLVRLFFFFAYIVAIFQHTKTVAGYTLAETALFFLTFNLVDILAQIFFRGIYSARRVVLEGDLDFYLIQPCSSLFRMACTTVDFLDVVTLLPVLVMTGLTFSYLPAAITWAHILLYVLLVLNGTAIAFAFHIFVAGLAVRTQELENTIWIYRNLMVLGRFPIDIYGSPVKWFLTLVIPIGVMISFPAKSLLGILSPAWIAYAFLLSGFLFWASLWFWQDALSRYTSVSS